MLIKGLYNIIETAKTENGFSAKVHLNKDHEIFKGHFPNNPVMPGVCMLQMISELVENFTKKQLFLNKATNVKFMAVINPKINADLNLQIDVAEVDNEVKIKNVTTFGETVALKLSLTFKIL